MMWQQCSIDIFLIDWERPKIFDNNLNGKSNLDTPSISSGVSIYYLVLNTKLSIFAYN